MTPKKAEAQTALAGALALTLLQDRLYEILLTGGAKKTGELVAAINIPVVNLHLAKHALRHADRFTQVQRKWDITSRWETPELPFDSLLKGFLKGVGRPMPVARIGEILGPVLGRDPEVMAGTVDRFAAGSSEYVVLDDGEIALKQWLLDVDHQSVEDVLFYNYMEPNALEPYQKAAAKLDWDSDPAAAAVQLVLESKQPVPVKVLLALAWQAHTIDLDVISFYEALLAEEGLSLTSDQQLYRKDAEKTILDDLKNVAHAVTDEPEEEEEEIEEEPPTITEADIDESVRIVLSRDESVRLAEVILQIFEIEESERAYAPTEETLKERLRHDPRLIWLGGTRFAAPQFIPDWVHTVPEKLLIPEYDFANLEGDHFDFEMETAGLESGIAKDIHDHLVQDVGDEDEPESPTKRPTSATCVVKYHHKEAGTFPIAQMPEGLFEQEPNIQLAEFRKDEAGWLVWINLETRLLSGMSEFYTALGLPVSGGKFHLAATDKSDVYEVEYNGESDETAAVAPVRLLELLQLKEEAESERLPTFEVLCRLLERQNQGMTYQHIFIELNLIRRVSRLLVASLLSGYTCFTRQGKTEFWVFDPKKKEQGFTRSKRKFITREY